MVIFKTVLVQGYLLRKPVFNESNPTKIEDMQLIPMDKNQVTYINSGIWNDNKTIRLPFLENARRAYRQLSLIEDAIVIYRLVRAPEKLVFNVDVGNMSPPKAEAYLRNLQQKYWSRHTYDTDESWDMCRSFHPNLCLIHFGLPREQEVKVRDVRYTSRWSKLRGIGRLNVFLKEIVQVVKSTCNKIRPKSSFSRRYRNIKRRA